ncbi:MAG: NADH-quinone oxidoreductase subunit H [Deltaproteobacteria bacterium]|nr:NADH-quinone oxidoreductase subunit H [Deltaproteobacteria bacterium]MBW2535950.1 NADH-quinone oxidoreductase subunit H [Deltaproteobacteria bacterium]
MRVTTLRATPRWLVVLLSAIALLAGLTSCAVDDSANLLNVIDVAPREVEVGDRIEVLGNNLPSGNIKEVSVRFRGSLHRPGQSTPDDAADIGTVPAVPAPDKVSFKYTEGLQGLICGRGDRASHTTFRGDVIVEFPGRTGGAPVTGVVRNVVLDFRPPSVRRIVMDARVEDAKQTLSALGLEINRDESPKAGGLLVGAVAAGKPAAEAGIEGGDVIVSFNGVNVASITDLIPRSGARMAIVTVKRGAAEPMVLEISTKDVKPGIIPNDVLAALIVLGIAAAILLIFMAPTAGIITVVERRVSGRMQSRIGPNRVGPKGFLQWLADGIKSFMKEDIVPTEVDGPMFRLAPYFVFVGVSATFVVMPFGQYLIAADLDIGILFIIAVTSLVAIGLLTGGWASNNKWSLLGGIRAAAQIVSYEIPAAIAIVCIVMMTGSLRMQDIILAQGGLGSISGGWQDVMQTGGWPWYWYIFRNPVTFALFFLFFTTSLAEGNRTPFDLPEGESEIVAGYTTEYSGMRYVFFMFAEWANVFVMAAIASALFLGGWQLPGVSPAAQEQSLALQLLGALMFLVKSWILIFVVIWIRWTLPRIRIDQLMTMCWKWLVPLSFGAFVLTGLWVLATEPIPQGSGVDAPTTVILSDNVQLGLGVAMFAVALLLVLHFIRRVRFNLRHARQPLRLNPFL